MELEGVIPTDGTVLEVRPITPPPMAAPGGGAAAGGTSRPEARGRGPARERKVFEGGNGLGGVQ